MDRITAEMIKAGGNKHLVDPQAHYREISREPIGPHNQFRSLCQSIQQHIHRPSMWIILFLYGIPQTMVSAIKKIYENLRRCGCFLPFTLSMTIDCVLHLATRGNHGIVWIEDECFTDLDFYSQTAPNASNVSWSRSADMLRSWDLSSVTRKQKTC